MSQIRAIEGVDPDGVRPSKVCEILDDCQVARILPTGAFKLISAINPDSTQGPRRAETFGRVLLPSIELAIKDPLRLEILLNCLPTNKVVELEDRIGMTLNQLRQKKDMEQPLLRKISGFFGSPTLDKLPIVDSETDEKVTPKRGLFPHQKRAASAVERYLYYEEGRAMLHLPTGVGKTRTAMSIVASHLRTCSNGVVLWLATTRELLEQAAEEFESTWEAVGDRQVECIRFWSSHNPSP